MADPEFWAVRCWGWACPDTGPCTEDSSSCPGSTGSRRCDHWDKSPDVSKIYHQRYEMTLLTIGLLAEELLNCSKQMSQLSEDMLNRNSVSTILNPNLWRQFSHLLSSQMFCLFTRPSWLECLGDSERIGNTEHLIILRSDWSVMTILNPHWRLITFSVIFLFSHRRDDIRELSSLLTTHGYLSRYEKSCFLTFNISMFWWLPRINLL